MKRIVLMTDPHRLDIALVQRLQWLFPECDLEIVPVTTDDRRTARPFAKEADGGVVDRI